MITIDSLDHLVLTVADLQATCDFYSQALGMEVITFGTGRVALGFGVNKINLHQAGREFEPKAAKPTPGSADLCFITSTKLDEVVQHLQELGILIEEGPVERTGAQYPLLPVYFRDPDGNLIGVANEHKPLEI